MRENLAILKLPADVRNIPIRPMHTTSAVALSCGDTIFVAGVRKNLYIFNIASAQLVRTVDAHFGRILNLRALTVNNSHLLISSSIDRSVKVSACLGGDTFTPLTCAYTRGDVWSNTDKRNGFQVH